MENILLFGMEKEKIEREKMIKLLKEKGTGNPEAKSALDKWTKEQEKRVEKSTDPNASINFNLERGRLYFEAGYLDEARENFEAALEQARNERKDKLAEEIEKEMDRLGL